MTNKSAKQLLLLAALLMLPTAAWAHPGNVDANGCHTNRKTGEYHCHPERARQHNRPGASGHSAAGGGYQQPRRSTGYEGGAYHTPSKSIIVTPEGQASRQRPAKPTRVNGLRSDLDYTVSNIRVLDGDTIEGDVAGNRIKIRLHGIDAPESGQADGDKCTAALRGLLAGREVTLRPMSTDRYGRTVGMVHADSANVNAVMVQAGYAWVYPKYCQETACADWNAGQKAAEQDRRGIWSHGRPMPPWDWRAR